MLTITSRITSYNIIYTNYSSRINQYLSDVIKTLPPKLPLVRGVLSLLGFLLQIKSVGLTRPVPEKKSHVIQAGTVIGRGIDPSPTNSCVVDPLGHS